MKYEVTEDDMKLMESDLRNDRVLKHLRNLSFYKFSIGDVLIREEKRMKYDGTGNFDWKVSMAACDLPYKYVYVFENALGVGYIRRLSVNGRKFVERPICVTELDPDQTRFLLDPEYADHMLLANKEDEFDAKVRYEAIKRKREKIHRKNKKLRVQIDNVHEAAAWIKSLKIGDQVWWGHNIGSIHKDAYVVTQINVKPLANDCSVQISAPGSVYGYGATLRADTLLHYSVFTQRPDFIDEVLD